MGWSIKKPLGGKNSFVRRNVSKPIPALVDPLGAAWTDIKANSQNKEAEFAREQQSIADQEAAALGDLDAMARIEEQKRQALGRQQQQQILDFAGQQEQRAKDYRTGLASSLASSGQQFFNQINPSLLEDLNARGLFTSQTARDKSQADALKEIELANQQQLMDFDTQSFNEINDIRGTGLSALLGGDQSALDAALDLRKAGIQRKFDQAAEKKEMAYAEMLAKRQSRDQLLSTIFPMLGQLGSSYLNSR